MNEYRRSSLFYYIVCLPERKRHTACRVASARSAVLSGVGYPTLTWLGGYPFLTWLGGYPSPVLAGGTLYRGSTLSHKDCGTPPPPPQKGPGTCDRGKNLGLRYPPRMWTDKQTEYTFPNQMWVVMDEHTCCANRFTNFVSFFVVP